MIGIYLITNIQNGMRYVGQSRHIEKRFIQHMVDDKKLNTKLGKDIQEYGAKNFTLTILEECDLKELDNKERFWINKLNTYPNEYNMTPGGRDQVCDLNKLRAIPSKEVVKFWQLGFSISEIQKHFKKSCTNTIKNQLIEEGYSLEEIEKRGQQKRRNQRISKSVCQYNLKGEFIAEFPSLNEAGRATNISSQNIGAVCRGKRMTAGGFIWKYKNLCN